MFQKRFDEDVLDFDVVILTFFSSAIVLSTFSKNWAFLFNLLVTLFQTDFLVQSQLVRFFEAIFGTRLRPNISPAGFASPGGGSQ